MTLSPIAQAVEPLRAAAVERARDFARKNCEVILRIYADRPESFDMPRQSTLSKREYQGLLGRRQTLFAITKPNATTFDRNAPRHRDEAGLEAFVTASGEAASLQYSAFIAKLEGKVGAHTAASLTGSHVWGHSSLRVTLANGTSETWVTHTIINVSKLGKVFNQWPSRKVKDTKGQQP
jgi:hypothetical protein